MGKKIIFKGRAVRLTDHFSTESRRKLNHIISEHINIILCTVSVSFKNERKGMSVSQTDSESQNATKKDTLFKQMEQGGHPKNLPRKQGGDIRRGKIQAGQRQPARVRGEGRGEGLVTPRQGAAFLLFWCPGPLCPVLGIVGPQGFRRSGLVSRYQTEGSGCKFQAENVGISSQPILLSTAASVQRLPTVMHELN